MRKWFDMTNEYSCHKLAKVGMCGASDAMAARGFTAPACAANPFGRTSDAYYEAARLALGLWSRSWPLGGHLYDPTEPDRDRLTLRLAGSSLSRLFAGSGAQSLLEADVMINVAGFAALLKRGCTIEWPSGEPEIEKCRHWLGQVMPEDRVEGELLQLLTETRVLLERPQIWSAVEAIATELLQHGKLYERRWSLLALCIARKMHGDQEVERGLKSWPGIAPYPALPAGDPNRIDTPQPDSVITWLTRCLVIAALIWIFAMHAMSDSDCNARRHAVPSAAPTQMVAPQVPLSRAP